jgi:hypothetical protein
MILSKALIEKKIFDKSQENGNIDFNIKKKIKRDVLSLFNDNYLSIEEVRNLPDYNYFWMLYDEIVKEDSQYKSIKRIIPPYSIHILCKLGNCSGEFTSDLNMINTISKINEDIFNDIKIINFCVGTIITKRLFREFCEKYNVSNNQNNSNLINYNGVKYSFKKGGIIFISLRLGYDFLNPEYYDVIPLLFTKFRNNFGIIGGIKKRAYYFIGMQGKNRLIFADPHLTQETKDNCEKYYETYNVPNIYSLDIKEMRCQFSFAIGVFSIKQLENFLDDAKWFSLNHKDVISIDDKTQ